jgi:hypothetical protein
MSRVLVTRFGERDTLKHYLIWAKAMYNVKRLALTILFVGKAQGIPRIPFVFASSVRLIRLAKEL